MAVAQFAVREFGPNPPKLREPRTVRVGQGYADRFREAISVFPIGGEVEHLLIRRVLDPFHFLVCSI